MATKYKFYADCPSLGKIEAIQRTLDDGTITSIPFDPANTDYQEFLQWKADGGVPEAAD